jgi:hypothetical protein
MAAPPASSSPSRVSTPIPQSVGIRPSSYDDYKIDPVLVDKVLAVQEDEKDARLIAEAETYEINGRSCVDDDETTVWLKYTRWPTKLADKPF